jgi:hypothetical protein
MWIWECRNKHRTRIVTEWSKTESASSNHLARNEEGGAPKNYRHERHQEGTERGFQPTMPSSMFPCPLFLGPLFFPFQARLKIKSITMCMFSLLRKWTKNKEEGKLKNNRNRRHQEKLHLSSTSTAGGGNK